MATQTFIIEASRETSVEALSGNDNDDYSSWTNRIDPIQLKRGDFVSVNTAIVNQKGASGQNNIEFTDLPNNSRDNLQSNFTMLNIGFYLCNNNTNSVPVPYKYDRKQADNSNPKRKTDGSGRVRIFYRTDRFNDDGDGIQNNFGEAIWYNPFKDYDGGAGGALPAPNEYTVDQLSSFENRNPRIPIDGSRFAKVANNFTTWVRKDSNRTILNTEVDLLTQDIPLHIEKGFKDAGSVGQTLTNILQSTNEPYSDTADDAVPRTELYTYAPNAIAQTQVNPRFNGYCMKTTGANLQPLNDSIPSNDGGSEVLYNSLYCKNPYFWKYGTQLLSNTETYDLAGNPLFNDFYASIRDTTTVNYPVLLWSTYTGADIDTLFSDIDQYDTYSPHFTEAKGESKGGQNVIEWKGFNAALSDYNDYYPELLNFDGAEYPYGQVIYKNGANTFATFIPTSANEQVEERYYRSFIDEDDPTFDRITAWCPKNILGSDAWNLSGDDLARDIQSANEFYATVEFGNGGADSAFYPQNDPYIKYSWRFRGASGGTNGNKYMYNIIIPNIIEGNKYTISFRTENIGSVGTGSAYAHAVGVIDRTTAFGMAGMNITADGFYQQTFTATATYLASSGLVFYYTHGVPYEQEIKLTEFSFLEADLEEGDQYTISDIFQFNNTNNTSTKIYKLRVNSGQLRNEKFDITGSTVFGGIFDGQYTAYERFTCYKSGNDIIAYDGVNSGDHDHPVIMLNRGADYDYIIYNQYGSKIWRIAQITKAPNVIVSGTTIGTVVGGNETSLRNPYRSGLQIYEYSNGNDWEYSVGGYIDFELGNIWNTNPDGISGAQYPCTNHIKEGLSTSRTIYNFASGNTYTGTSGYSAEFTDTAGVISNFNYDASCVLHHGGIDYDLYFQTQTTSGLSGVYYYNTGSAGNTFTITNVSSGTIVLGGAFSTTLTKAGGTTLTSRTDTFDYDYHFDASGDIYLHTQTDGATPYKNGTYEFTFTNGTLIYPDLNGTWTYDDTTGEIDFFRANGNLYFTLYNGSTGVNPGNTLATLTTTITSHIADPLPTITAGAPINKTLRYSHTFQLHVSYESNPLTLYLAYNNDGDADDTDLQGQRGRLVWLGATWNETSWDWNGGGYMDLNIDGGQRITYTGTAPTLTNIVQYDTAQRNTINLVPYDFPSNGKQYGYSSVDLLGNGQLTTNPHLPLPVSSTDVDEVFLAIGNMNTFDDGYSSGGVYEDIDDTINPICQWEVIFNDNGTCNLVFKNATGTITYMILQEFSSNVKRYGWRLIKTSKYNRNDANQQQTLTIQDGEDFNIGTRSTSNTGTHGKIPPNGTYNLPGDTGQLEFLEHQGLIRTHSNMPRHTMLLTNIKYTMDNIKRIENFFRKNEVYDGHVESSRAAIAKDIDNFFVKMDIGRTEDNKLAVDNDVGPYTDDEPLFQYYMRDYGRMGKDDSDINQFTDPDGHERTGSNENFGNIGPRMRTDDGHEQRIKLFTRWEGAYDERLIATNRLQGKMSISGDFIDNGYVYGKNINETDFQKNYPDLHNYVSSNNVGVYPFLCKDFTNPGQFILCCAFETYETTDINNKLLLKIQDLTYFTFSPSFLDNDYIIAINPDNSFVPIIDTPPYQFGAIPYYITQYNNNHINIGAAPIIEYDSTLNRFKWSYLHTPFRFSEQTGVDANLEEEVSFLNSSDLMIMKQGINELNLQSGGNLTANPPIYAKNVHRGLADAQCGIFINDLYGQYVSDTYITSKDQGVKITRDSYDGTLFYYLGFSYYDLLPIRFSIDSFNNRFNQNTFNTITGEFKTLGVSPFTTNSDISVGDQQKTNIFTGCNLEKTYDGNTPPYFEIPQPTLDTKVGTPSFNLGFNNLQAVSLKSSSAEMTSRSVIINLQSPFYRIMSSIPVDTLGYKGSNGSLACIGYMNKNYQSQSFIYSFASDYGGYLTQDMTLTNIHTEIRDPRGFKVNSIDDKSVVFYKVVRQISLENPEDIEETPEVKELKDIEKELKEQGDDLEDIEDELKGGRGEAGVAEAEREKTGIRIGEDAPLNEITENVMISIIRALISNTTLRSKPAKDISNKLARFFRENNNRLNRIFENAKNNPKKLQTELNKLSGLPQLNFSATGRLLDSDINRGASITEEGARSIFNVIFDQFKDKLPPTAKLSEEINKQIQALGETGDIQLKQGPRLKSGELSANVERLINEVMTSKNPFRKLFKNINRGDALEIGKILKDLTEIVRQYRQATTDRDKRGLIRAYIEEVLDVVDTRQIKLTDAFREIAPSVLRVDSLPENLQKQIPQRQPEQRQPQRQAEDVETKTSREGGAAKDDKPPPKTDE